MLRVKPPQAIKRMWAHGFDPVRVDGERGHWWDVALVQQVIEERRAWGLDERERELEQQEAERARAKASRAAYHAALAAGEPPTYDYLAAPRPYDYEAARDRRERIARQLESAPVTAADLDYVATRAGERRGNKSLSVTSFRLREAEERK